jgi:coiled-coil domain-containing protein 12
MQESTATNTQRKLKFRNYRPNDSSLGISEVKTDEGINDVKTNEPKQTLEEKEIHNEVQSKAKYYETVDILKEELSRLEAMEEVNIAPRKANWDLKQQIEKKMEKLNRRTQRAIVDILREKMITEGVNEDN